MTAARLEPRVGLIPILRAGLGMVDAMLELLPTAEVWHIGLYRDERTLKPVEYYNKLPDAATVQVCLVLDPMLATGGSAAATIDILKQVGRGADQTGVAHRRARGRGHAWPARTRTSTFTSRRSTRTSTSAATSSRDWATRAIGSSARSPVQPRSRDTARTTRRPRWCAASSATCRSPDPRHPALIRTQTKRPEGTAAGPLMQSLVPLAAPSGRAQHMGV